MRSSVSIRGRTESAPRCIIGTKAEAVEARQARRSPAACMLEDDEQRGSSAWTAAINVNQQVRQVFKRIEARFLVSQAFEAVGLERHVIAEAPRTRLRSTATWMQASPASSPPLFRGLQVVNPAPRSPSMRSPRERAAEDLHLRRHSPYSPDSCSLSNLEQVATRKPPPAPSSPRSASGRRSRRWPQSPAEAVALDHGPEAEASANDAAEEAAATMRCDERRLSPVQLAWGRAARAELAAPSEPAGHAIPRVLDALDGIIHALVDQVHKATYPEHLIARPSEPCPNRCVDHRSTWWRRARSWTRPSPSGRVPRRPACAATAPRAEPPRPRRASS